MCVCGCVFSLSCPEQRNDVIVVMASQFYQRKAILVNFREGGVRDLVSGLEQKCGKFLGIHFYVLGWVSPQNRWVVMIWSLSKDTQPFLRSAGGEFSKMMVGAHTHRGISHVHRCRKWKRI